MFALSCSGLMLYVGLVVDVVTWHPLIVNNKQSSSILNFNSTRNIINNLCNTMHKERGFVT